MEKRDKLDVIADRVLQNNTVDPYDVTPHLAVDIWERVCAVVEQDKDKDQYKNKDFYLVYLFRMEPLIKNVFHPWIFSRLSCPTPVCKQAVWKYHHISGTLDFLWCLPDLLGYKARWNNRHKADNKDKLTQWVVMNETGTLLDFVKKENREDELISNFVIMIDKEHNDRRTTTRSD